MGKFGEKHFTPLSPASPQIKRNEFDADAFATKAPAKYRQESPRTVPKPPLPSPVHNDPSRLRCNGNENGPGVAAAASGDDDDDELDSGFPIIKATEGPIIVTFGGIQLVAGILMIAFGILAMMHEASLSSVGAGLWGGAMGAANGFVGIVAGFKGCYQSSDRISPLAITVYLALCLVAIGVSNLALVLTATGLLRDSQRSDYFLPLNQEDYTFLQIDDSARTNWAPVLANIGLLIITSVECLATIAAAFRCYWYVCRCRRKRRAKMEPSRITKNDYTYEYDSPDITTASYCSSSRSKQKLVRRWLGQQQMPSVHTTNRSSVPFSSSYGPVPPYYTTVYPSSSFVSYSDYNYMLPNVLESYYPQWPRVSLYPQQPQHYSRPQQEPRNVNKNNSRIRKLSDRKYSPSERLRKLSESTITEEEFDKNYTGMDREIAEEFISVAMEAPKRS